VKETAGNVQSVDSVKIHHHLITVASLDSSFAFKIERMKTIRDHYLSRQAHEAKEAREKGELRATSSIMSLGLIGKEGNGSDSESSSASSSSSSPSSSSPPPVAASEGGKGSKKEKSE